MNKVIFISDYYANNTALLQNLGTKHKLGGAEQDDLAMLFHLEKKLGKIPKIECSKIQNIDPEYIYLIANFATLKEKHKQVLVKHKNYVIYEHDHKYCATRNPGLYKDCIVPDNLKTNIGFYENAKAVFCMTNYHKIIMDKNILCNSIALNGSFWTPEELSFIELCTLEKKNDRWFIYGNDSYHKGLQQGIAIAEQNNLNYSIVKNQNTRKEFLRELSKHYGLIFQPMSPETCSRLAIEAKMLNLKVITNSFTGAAHEPWFSMCGTDLIEETKNKLMPASINIIASYL